MCCLRCNALTGFDNERCERPHTMIDGTDLKRDAGDKWHCMLLFAKPNGDPKPATLLNQLSGQPHFHTFNRQCMIPVMKAALYGLHAELSSLEVLGFVSLHKVFPSLS